jgi:hypothetical protein
LRLPHVNAYSISKVFANYSPEKRKSYSLRCLGLQIS